jgi:hypothetical protein
MAFYSRQHPCGTDRDRREDQPWFFRYLPEEAASSLPDAASVMIPSLYFMLQDYAALEPLVPEVTPEFAGLMFDTLARNYPEVGTQGLYCSVSLKFMTGAGSA